MKYKVKNLAQGKELVIEGVIDSFEMWGDEYTPDMLRQELQDLNTNDLTVTINSPGGDVFSGVAMYNALKDLDANVTVNVIFAASIASVISMAGDKVVMLPGSQMMIHKPWTMALGNADELGKTQEMLNSIEESIIPIYAEKTGKSADEIATLLEAETWMSPEKAVEMGFADEVGQSKATQVVEQVMNMLGIKPTVENTQMVLAGDTKFMMSAVKKVNAETEEQVTTVTEDTPKEVVETVAEPEVPQEPEAPAEVQEDEQTQEETQDEAQEQEAQTSEVKEVTPTTEDTNVTENKEKEMNEQDVKNQVVAPATEAPKASMSVRDYVQSKASMQDFADILMANAGAEASEVKAAWESHLSAKMGITNPEVLLPQGVIDAVEDAFKEGGEIWNRVAKTGLDVITAVLDTVTGEDSRAKGHKRGTDKQEEVITLADRKIRAQFIYKYLTLNKEDIRENRSSGALLRYVLSELPQRIIREVERAIVIGDGRLASSDLKVKSFVSLKADAADATTPYAQEYTPVVGDDVYATLVKATGLVKADGAKVLIAKQRFVTGVALLKVNGTYMFTPGANLASALGFESIITPDWLDDTTDPENDAYVATLGKYKTVGDTAIESYTNFALKANKNEFLQELYTGGALAAADSAVAIKKAA